MQPVESGDERVQPRDLFVHREREVRRSRRSRTAPGSGHASGRARLHRVRRGPRGGPVGRWTADRLYRGRVEVVTGDQTVGDRERLDVRVRTVSSTGPRYASPAGSGATPRCRSHTSWATARRVATSARGTSRSSRRGRRSPRRRSTPPWSAGSGPTPPGSASVTSVSTRAWSAAVASRSFHIPNCGEQRGDPGFVHRGEPARAVPGEERVDVADERVDPRRIRERQVVGQAEVHEVDTGSSPAACTRHAWSQ